jgi:Flp pilus assembly secretin CpaC
MATIVVLSVPLGVCIAGAEQIPDSALKRSLEQALHRDARLRDTQIQVSVLSGSVTLKGTARDYLDRHVAQQIAERTVGAQSVSNQIQVQREPRDDQRIAEDVERRRTRNYVALCWKSCRPIRA